jgi:ribosomal-protein-alanine N-acetyltransferase
VRPPLLTSRLQLRLFRLSDAEPLLEVLGDPVVMCFVGPTRTPFDHERLDAYLARRREHWRRHGFGILAVAERTGGRLVGECGLELLEGGPDIELTYTFARRVRGRGYATEAAAAVIGAAFGDLDCERIVACVHPENVASRRVAEKLGMRGEGKAFHCGAELMMFGLARADALRSIAPDDR